MICPKQTTRLSDAPIFQTAEPAQGPRHHFVPPLSDQYDGLAAVEASADVDLDQIRAVARGSAPQPPLADDPEARMRVGLLEQRDAVDCE